MKTITDKDSLRMLNPVHPGRFLKSEIVEAHGISVTQAAKILRVARPTLSILLNAKAVFPATWPSGSKRPSA